MPKNIWFDNALSKLFERKKLALNVSNRTELYSGTGD